MGRRLSKAKKRKLLSLLEQDPSISAYRLAKEAGVSTSTAYEYKQRFLREAGLEGRESVAKRLDEVEEMLEILEDALQGVVAKLRAMEGLAVAKRNRCANFDEATGLCENWYFKGDPSGTTLEYLYRFSDGAWKPIVREHPLYCTACTSFKPREATKARA